MIFPALPIRMYKAVGGERRENSWGRESGGVGGRLRCFLGFWHVLLRFLVLRGSV